MSALANLVFPLFDLPYMAGLLSPWFLAAAVVAEILVFYLFQFRTQTFGAIFSAVFIANVISTLAGVLLLALLPSPENGHSLVYLTFVVAWALSVIIEYWVYWIIPQWRRFQHLLIATAASNVASYCILGISAWRQML